MLSTIGTLLKHHTNLFPIPLNMVLQPCQPYFSQHPCNSGIKVMSNCWCDWKPCFNGKRKLFQQWNLTSKNHFPPYSKWKMKMIIVMICIFSSGHEIAPNTGANVTKFFTLVTKSWKLVTKLVTRMFHHNLTKRYSELNRFAKINPWQTSSLSLFSKHSTCISIDDLMPA